MDVNKVNIQSEVDKIKAHWVLNEVAKVNNHAVKFAKLKGDFEMHTHENGEKLFYVIDGTMCIQFSDEKTIEVHKGEFVVLPSGIAHKPYAPEEVCVMLFEPI